MYISLYASLVHLCRGMPPLYAPLLPCVRGVYGVLHVLCAHMEEEGGIKRPLSLGRREENSAHSPLLSPMVISRLRIVLPLSHGYLPSAKSGDLSSMVISRLRRVCLSPPWLSPVCAEWASLFYSRFTVGGESCLPSLIPFHCW